MTRTAVCPVRAAVLALLLLLGLAAPAVASGTGGIEVTPVPGVVDGRQVTQFSTDVPSRGDTQVRLALRNVVTRPATARLYAASAVLDGRGSYVIGDPGSSPYVSYPDRMVTLAVKQLRLTTFTVHPGPHGRPTRTSYAAIVVEVKNGAVVQRAATLVVLHRGRTVPLPLLVVLVAVALLLLGATGVLLARRRRHA